MRRAAAVFACVGALALLVAGPAGAQQPTPAAPQVIDGPSADILSLGGMSVARDGTGGLVYLKQVAGVGHVFVSRIVGGVFQPPEQVDASLVGPSSQPVIAAGNGGLVLVAFINGGVLYVVDRLSSTAAASGPIPLLGGASNPAIAISNFGKAYLAFTLLGSGGTNVRAAYYNAGRWALEASPLDAAPGNNAGSGTGRPAVAAAGDGVGIVAWGEAGHVYARRVWGTSPSVAVEQADPPGLSGWTEVSAGEPAIGSGGDSSYAAVAFQEFVSNGSQTQSRVLMRTLHGSQFEPVAQADGLTTPGPEGANAPQVAIGEFGRGLITSAHDTTNALDAMAVGTNDAAGRVARVDSLTNAGAPSAVPALAGLFSDFIAWQQDPGPPGLPEIRIRYAPANSALGPEVVVSSPSLGPANASAGLAAAGDASGDAAAAWVQGSQASAQIVAAQLYQTEGSLAPITHFAYARTRRPSFAWTPARALWGPIRYTVTLDGAPLPPTTSTSLTAPTALADGPHNWQVVATNPAGLTRTARGASVWVDATPPTGTITLTGKRRAGSFLHLMVSATDAPPGEPPASASGIASVVVHFGDGSIYPIRRGKFHSYKRAGRYKVSVKITDRAGNVTTLTTTLKIAPKPKPKPKRKGKGKGAPKPHHSRLAK